MDEVFDWCVRLLILLAGQFGMTYKEINVWIFVIIWPVITVALIVFIVLQQMRIRKLLDKKS
jgi:hypothetical protein